MIVFPIGDSGQRLIFSPAVLTHLNKYRQTRWWQREAGGQLFARFALPDIQVEEATGPRQSDSRTRNSYRPDRLAEQHEITIRYANGLHFIGDWHTHPEPIPTPSRQDAESMRDLVIRSEHALNAFALVIVGRNPIPEGLSVSLFSSADAVALHSAPGRKNPSSAPPHL